MTRTTGILGTGGWGTALSMVAAENSDRVFLWGRRRGFVRQLRETRENTPYLPGVRIPDRITLTHDLETVTGESDMLVIAIPTQHIRSTLEKRLDHLPAEGRYVSAAKGMESDTFLRPTRILKDLLGKSITTGVLSGPSHAEEVAEKKPASLVSAAETGEFAHRIQERFMTDFTRIYTNPDEVGVELGGALKNIIAIASGICIGRDLGMNAQSALLSRGLVEIARCGAHLGAQRATFYGLSGMGDLITTCMSPHGRNRSVGIQLGEGKTREEIEESMDKVAEGVHTTRAVHEMAQQEEIELPLTEQVYRVLFEKKDVDRAVEDLMHREPRSEAEDLLYE